MWFPMGRHPDSITYSWNRSPGSGLRVVFRHLIGNAIGNGKRVGTRQEAAAHSRAETLSWRPFGHAHSQHVERSLAGIAEKHTLYTTNTRPATRVRFAWVAHH